MIHILCTESAVLAVDSNSSCCCTLLTAPKTIGGVGFVQNDVASQAAVAPSVAAGVGEDVAPLSISQVNQQSTNLKKKTQN